ncbi:MAG: phage holin family protein [Patescibacteria group bacterium]
MYLLFRWVINAIAMIGITYIVPGFNVDSFYHALIAALVLGLVNALIRPIILILTIPVNVMTLGLFTFVINALMVWFVSTLVKGFAVEGFVAAFLVAMCLWVVSWVTNKIVEGAKHS